MITTLFLDAKLDKQLQALDQSDKKAALAAEQARDIIAKLKGGRFSSMEAGNITKHGEQRIKGCIKYNLGSGYRLVTLKQGRDLYLLYAGSHDDCHRWIENNRELPVAEIRRRSRRMMVDKPFPMKAQCTETEEETMDWEDGDSLSGELNDRQLRMLFRGLIESVQTR